MTIHIASFCNGEKVSDEERAFTSVYISNHKYCVIDSDTGEILYDEIDDKDYAIGLAIDWSLAFSPITKPFI